MTDQTLAALRVVNSTLEADGSAKDYWLRVPPDVTLARDAVAWTFDMGAGEYRVVGAS